MANIATAPDWLARRGGSVQRSGDGRRWLVMFENQPQYALAIVPVGGQLGTAILQTVSGRRIDSTSKAPTEEAALAAGLEDLRKALGW
jgi:hypothetical protein